MDKSLLNFYWFKSIIVYFIKYWSNEKLVYGSVLEYSLQIIIWPNVISYGLFVFDNKIGLLHMVKMYIIYSSERKKKVYYILYCN
jgi:hypothetical protein